MTEVNVIRGNRKVEWVDLGEGWNGDYNPSDPEDTPLLRFDILQTPEEAEPDWENFGNWEQIDDASYCTQMPADSSEADLRHGAWIIMDATYGKTNIKKICEELSWISPGWLEQPKLKRF